MYPYPLPWVKAILRFYVRPLYPEGRTCFARRVRGWVSLGTGPDIPEKREEIGAVVGNRTSVSQTLTLQPGTMQNKVRVRLELHKPCSWTEQAKVGVKFSFVFGICSGRICTVLSATLTGNFRGFSQYLHIKAAILRPVGRTVYSRCISIYYLPTLIPQMLYVLRH
jgi:hypothetical protein